MILNYKDTYKYTSIHPYQKHIHNTHRLKVCNYIKLGYLER